jgi:solute:Na+ symporter, SSS family
MSTANGSILVISVVLMQSVTQNWRQTRPADATLLMVARIMALPTAAAAGLLAFYRPEPGILLIVAFDIVLAGCVVPLFAGVYWPKANQAGAIAAIVVGSMARIVAHFVTPGPWAGLDTLLPPVLSAIVFYLVCQLTRQSAIPRVRGA